MEGFVLTNFRDILREFGLFGAIKNVQFGLPDFPGDNYGDSFQDIRGPDDFTTLSLGCF